MSKVRPENLMPEHTKAARALLDWRSLDLAEKAGLSGSLIRKFETFGKASEKARQAMIDALEAEGVKLYNGGQPGARLMKAKS